MVCGCVYENGRYYEDMEGFDCYVWRDKKSRMRVVALKEI